jgi:hypothetical protein
LATALIDVRAGKFIVMNEYVFTHAVFVETIVLVGLCHTSMVAVDMPSKSTNDVNVIEVEVLLMCIYNRTQIEVFVTKRKPPPIW